MFYQIRPIELSNNKVLDQKKPNSTIPKQINKFDNHFDWSLQYLTRWIGLLGIGLPTPIELSSNCYQRTLSFVMIVSIQLWLVVHVSLNAKFVSVTYVRQISTTATSWNFIIDNLNLAMYVVGEHAFLLFLTRPKTWKDLTDSFKLLDDNSANNDIYLKCRRLTINAIIYITVSVIGPSIILITDLVLNESSLIRKSLDVIGFTSKVIPTTALALFCTLARYISLHLAEIRNRIEQQFETCQRSIGAQLELQRLQIKSIKKQHFIVCKALQKLNRYFGVFLTIEVSFVFVGIINCCMFLLMGATSQDGLVGTLNFLVMIDELLHLFFLTSFSDNITSEVALIYEALTDLTDRQPLLHDEVCLFSEQLFHTRSHIDAMGFFHVNKQLFPSLIGTTLTYFLILLQFHSAETQ